MHIYVCIERELLEREKEVQWESESEFEGQEEDKDKKVMSLLKKMVCPVRKLLFAIAARVKSRKDGASLLKLHNDIQTCGYQDIQVMWEMIRRSESELLSQNSKQKQRSFWRFFVWHNHDRAHTSP